MVMDQCKTCGGLFEGEVCPACVGKSFSQTLQPQPTERKPAADGAKKRHCDNCGRELRVTVGFLSRPTKSGGGRCSHCGAEVVDPEPCRPDPLAQIAQQLAESNRWHKWMYGRLGWLMVWVIALLLVQILSCLSFHVGPRP